MNTFTSVKFNVFRRVFTHFVSLDPQVGGLAGVLLPSLRLGGISKLLDVTQSRLGKRSGSLGSCLWALQNAAQTPASFPCSAGLSASPCSQWQLGKH